SIFVMLVRGAEPMEKRQRRGLLPVPGFFCSHVLSGLIPLILWITVLPFLCESVPLAAAERPSVASQ
ncbi:hypothetical protein O5824_26665, partial [Escherichia coli]|nr:hypothetical protein [Escherichia coli]